MTLWLRHNDKDIKVDFEPTNILTTPSLYLLIFSEQSYRYIFLNDTDSILTDKYNEFHLTRLDHLLYGSFIFQDIKYDCQVGAFIRRQGMQGFDHLLIRHYPFEITFTNYFFDFDYTDTDFRIIDYNDYCLTRDLVGHEKITFKEYIEKLLSKERVTDTGLTILDDTSFFNVVGNGFNKANIITSKGMDIFFEEQIDKNNR